MSHRSPRTCTVDGCDRPMRAYGLCQTHRRQQIKGRPLTLIQTPGPGGLPCSVDGCDTLARSLGMCHNHYETARRNGGTGRVVRPCVFGGCIRPGLGRRQLCGSHQEQLRRRGSMDLLTPLLTLSPRDPAAVCSFDGCGRPRRARDLCGTHCNQLTARGDRALLTPIRELRPGQVCSGPECDRPASAHGLCKAHRNQRLKRADGALTVLGSRRPAKARAADPKPSKPRNPKPAKAPASRLPAGWDKPAPKPAAPKQGGGTSESTLLYMTPVTPPLPEQVEAVLALIADEPDADLLAEMLGLAAA